VTDLFWPTLSTGVVPIRDGPTPPSLGTLWLHLPATWSIALAAIPIALFFYAAAKALLHSEIAPEPVPADVAPASARVPGDEPRPTPELAATR
jgi:hypothetical protein